MPEVAFRVQENIKHNVEAMTEFHIAEVNVVVKGVVFNEEKKEEVKVEPTEEVEEQIEKED